MKITRLVSAIGILVCGLTVSAPAGMVNVDNSPYQAGHGGEFNAVVIDSGTPGLPLGSQFPTFCLEKNEYITLGNSYTIRVNTYADAGGVGGRLPGTQMDPLSPMTAWLYNEFLNGDLPGYNYTDTASRKNSAAALQNAIWYLEDEITTLPSGLAGQFIQMANANPWWQTGSIGNIRVMNLFRDADCQQGAQDLLCRVIPTVPAPAAILLVGVGTAVVGGLRRRMM